ncbi:MAG: MBOAT family protein [Microscillaceae bacterium]|nr:MBOAT family protein [Microscillaceae bacterium]
MNLIWDKLSDVLLYSKQAPLLFNSGVFMSLFTIFLMIYALLYKNVFARTLYITVFSYYFYYKSSGAYVLIFIFSTLINYLAAQEIHHAAKASYRKRILILSILFNVGFLIYFKYTNFLLGNFDALLGDGKFKPLDIFLPIGISFYTFQTISYVIDVYRRSILPTRNVLDFAFYLSFFPQLVAGPIVRARDFLSQIPQNIVFSRQDMSQGLFMVLKGLFKKAIIADFLAQYVDIVYGNPAGYSGFEHLMAMYAYTMQIYCDFSGYSDMAIGLALIVGFHLPDNFRSPYNALDITEFWRRWHMTLSTWLRDYIYIPLGGNRHGEERQFLYLMITMLVGGLWHGADWKFVFWGGMHGLGLIIHKIFSQTARDLEWNQYFLRPLGWILTFHFVAFLWIFFRAESFTDAALAIRQMIFHLDFAYFPPFLKANGLVFLMMVLGYVIHFVRHEDKERLAEYYGTLPLLAKAAILILMIQIILQVQSENVQPFIYFQF